MMRRDLGFGLIELMIAITIIGLLIVFAGPSYSIWMSNTRIRNATESIQNGIRLARSEAVQRGAPARFEIGTVGADWTVCIPLAATPGSCSGGTALQAFNSGGGANNVRIGGSTSLANIASFTAFGSDLSTSSVSGMGITFDGLGRALAGTTPLVRIDASSATGTGVRRLSTIIASGGSARMCDPALDSATYPQGCP